MKYMELDEQTRENLIEAINNAISEMDRFSPGSDEYIKQVDCVNKLYKLYLDEYGKDVDRKKIENDWFLKERDIAMKESTSENEKKLYNRISWDTALKCFTLSALTVASIAVQVNGHIFPENYMKFARMIKL